MPKTDKLIDFSDSFFRECCSEQLYYRHQYMYYRVMLATCIYIYINILHINKGFQNSKCSMESVLETHRL